MAQYVERSGSLESPEFEGEGSTKKIDYIQLSLNLYSLEKNRDLNSVGCHF